MDLTAPSQFPAAFHAARDGRADALIVTMDMLTLTNREQIAGLAAESRLPAMYGEQSYVTVGGLMGYGANWTSQFRRAAEYADKILRDAKPADLPIDQPTKFEFVVNLKTAQALGLTIPQSVMMQTTEVIQ